MCGYGDCDDTESLTVCKLDWIGLIIHGKRKYYAYKNLIFILVSINLKN